ncbi:MAG: hypothetical protein U5R49_10855 [Deltaproteobacteria bacterium]|nr:hypothetical protein [Deltaproteobacteria bacterium]
MKIFSGLFSILLLVGYWTCNTVAANAEWTKINLGQAYENADIYDVWGTSGADLFAVGMNFEEGKWDDRYGLIIHYDGTIWHAMEGPNAKWLYCVWGSSSSDIFAGGEEVDGTFGGAILHFDGAAWTEMDHPNFSGNWVDDIWGTSASDVYAVGAGRILHYDGASWTTSYESTDPFFLSRAYGEIPQRTYLQAPFFWKGTSKIMQFCTMTGHSGVKWPQARGVVC